MRDVVCWDRQQVHRIINPEAESVDDAIFRAVHSDQLLSVAPPVGEQFQQLTAGAFNQLTPHQLLAEFLRSDRSHMQLAFYGRAGSGKSHLVHWMRLMIPSTPERLVLTIPKAGTSLRSIVELIIGRLDPAAQPPFRDALNRSGDAALTREGQRHEVLNQLAQAIREDAASRTQARTELDEALLQSLPDLFQDAYIRRVHFHAPGINDRRARRPRLLRPFAVRTVRGAVSFPGRGHAVRSD